MVDLLARLREALDANAREACDQALARARAGGAAAVAELFPALPRRVGRAAIGAGRARVGAGEVDLGAWRACDAAAFLALEAAGAPPAALVDLFAHGDLEERAMALRALAARPVDAATVALLGEAQRTNNVGHFEAACCDSDLLARTHGAPGFGRDELNRLLLKAAFLDLPLDRMWGVERHANAELSRMLQDLATEREAATRAVWADTTRLCALAPAPGTVARVIGDLEHGSDPRRLAAARALAALGRPELARYAEERLPREPREDVRAALAAAVARLGRSDAR
jgi:hypothetical protein